MSRCPHCDQEMPVEVRRDPPLPPIVAKDAVMLNDLPPDARDNAVRSDRKLGQGFHIPRIDA